MPRCKAPEILRSEAYFEYASTTKGEGNAAEGRFSTASRVILSATVAPKARNPRPSPPIGSPSLLPVARHPNPITVIVIIGSIIPVRGVIGLKVDRRGRQKNWRCKK
jgi:hypothetical protein